MSTKEIRIGEDVFACQVLKEGFLPSLEDWAEEGLGHFQLKGATMLVDACEGGYSAFYREKLPADILIRFVAKAIPPAGQNNINIITHCLPAQPGRFPIVPVGRYKGYQEMPNYIVTFVGDFDEQTGRRQSQGRTRLRRNPSFELLQETHPASELEREYEIVFTCKAGHIRYYLDGIKIHDWQDPSPHPGGYFALRTYSTVLEYRDLLLAQLV